MKNLMFKVLGLIERKSAALRGKGYGALSFVKEVGLVSTLMPQTPGLAIDIGGNVGHYTAELRKVFPQMEIHVFEPAHVNVEVLRKRYAGDKAVHIVPNAVGDKTATMELFADVAGSGLASLTKRNLDHFGIEFDHHETVECVRFDDYWTKQLGSRKIDLMKLDVEGHEMSALRGAEKALAQTQLVQFEFGGCNIDTRTFFKDFFDFFSERGFELSRITPLGLERIAGYRENDEFFQTTNYIARRI